MKFADKELNRKAQGRYQVVQKIREVKFNNHSHQQKDIIIDVECEIIEESDTAQRYLPIKK